MTIELHVTDDVSDFSHGHVEFTSPSGVQRRVTYFDATNLVSGNLRDGEFATTLTLPQYTESGTWQLKEVSLADQPNAGRAYSKDWLITHGFPVTFSVAPGGDTAAPYVASFAITPLTIDTSLASQTITVTAHLTDDLGGSGAGEYATQFHFASPTVHQQLWAMLDAQLHLVAGTALDGVFESTVAVPQYSASGTWHLDGLTLYDSVGNHRKLYETDMLQLGFPTTLMIAPGGDSDPPAVAEFDFEPKAIEVTMHSQTITVTFRISDNLSGASAGDLQFADPTTRGLRRVNYTSTERISGDGRDGRYIVPVAFSPTDKAGIWHLNLVGVFDNVGNRVGLDESSLSALGFPTTLHVVNRAGLWYFPIIGKQTFSAAPPSE